MRRNAVILFDTVCNLCRWSVRFIIKHDPRGYFAFGSMQSESARTLLEDYGFAPKTEDTIILIEGSEVSTKSDAVLKIAKRLSGLWSLAAILMNIPRSMRDWCYDIIARNRYRWFGKNKKCLVAPKEYSNRFIGKYDDHQECL